MINLQPLIEKFKKAVYGRDVRQSIVDLAQAIGDNHNEQEGLRDEVKSLDSDIKVKKEEAEQAINIAISSVNSAKTEAEESINATINTLNTGKEEIENLANAKDRFLEIKFQSLKQTLADFATTKDEEIRNTADGKIDEIATTATTESDKIKVVTTTANESKTALESTIQQSESSKTSLDSTIQRGTAKDKELENHIAEINQIIAEGKAVTKDELKAEILKLKGLSIEVLDTLPESGKAGVIYFIKSTTQDEQNLFDEYAWVNDKWEMIGSKSIDLSQYATLKSVDDLKNSVFTNIGELNNSLADATQKMENKLSTYPTFEDVKPQIITLDYDGFTWYLQIESIKYDSNESFRLTGYCEFDLLEHESKLYKDDNGYDSLQIFKFSNDLNVRERIMLSDFFGGCISFNIVETQYVIASNPRVFLDSNKAIYIQWDRPKEATGDEYLNFIIRTEAYM